MLEKLVVVLFVQTLGQAGNPFGGINGKGVLGAHAFAVGPVRGNTGLGHLMHLTRADLHLNPFAVAARHRGVDRPIAVVLGLADVILETPRHSAPALVDDAKDPITVSHRIANHAKAVDVGQARKGQILLLHLAPDRIWLFRPTIDRSFNLHFFKFRPDVGGDLVNHIARFFLQGQKPADDRIARLGVQNLEGQILQLLAHPLHPHATSQGCIDLHGFAGLLHLLFRFHAANGAHVVEPVGEFDQNHPQVFRHCHEQLAKVLSLLRFGRGQLQVGQLGHAIDQLGHFGAEQALHLGIGGFGVLNRVVQQGRDDGRIVQLLFGQNGRNGNGVGKVRLTRFAELPLMHLHAVSISTADQISIGTGVVVSDKGDEVFNVDHHRPARPCGLESRSVFALGFHQHAQHPLFRHVVGHRAINLARHQKRHLVFFRLVYLDLGLVRLDHPLAQRTGKLGFFCNLAQSNNGVFVVVAVHSGDRAGLNFARPMGGQHHQFKPVGNLVNAIFDRHAGHGMLQ